MNFKNHEREKIFKKQRGLICLCIILLFALLNGCVGTEKNADEEKRTDHDTSKLEQIVTITESPVKENLSITNTPVINGEQDVDTNINNNFDVADIEKTPISCRIENGTLFFSGNGRLTKEMVNNLIMEIGKNIEVYEIVKVVIEDGITGIGAEAFWGYNFIKELEIAGSVKRIGYCAFEDCSLERVKMLEGVQYIDVEAFSGCDSLEEVEIPQSVEIISAGAFLNTFWLEKQKKENPLVTVNGILLDATEYSGNIELSQNISYTTIDAFWDTQWFEQQREEKELLILNGILIYGGNTSGDVIIPEGVRYIADGAFMECEGITRVVIPDGVEGIGTMAFYCCDKLEKVELPDSVRWMGTMAFAECTSLESVKIPEGLDGIADGIFSDCSKLNKVEISIKTLEYIGFGAFSRCGNLERIELPQGLDAIETGAFYGCSKLSDVVLPETLRYLGGEAFKYCESMTSIEIPQKIERIEGETFAQTGLNKIQIPNTVQYIGEEAFYLCPNLAQIDIPDHITTVGYKAFDKTPWLEKLLQEKTLFIIGNSLLAVSTSVESVTIPEHIQIIECGAFENSVITEIEIPKTVKEIKAAAFAGCSALSEITLPNHITILEERVFEGCTSLTNVKLPNELCEIGDSAFENCTSLESIEVPETVSRIGAYAFSGCSKLASIEIPEAVREIEYSLFEYCDSLVAVVIPEGVTKINPRAFGLCKKLVSIAIPKSVVEINSENVFYRCDKLTLYCDKDSFAEQYAKENEIEYITVDEEFWTDGAPIPLTPPSLQEKLQNNPNRMIDVNGDECYAVWGETGAYVWRYVDATFEQRAYIASGFAGDMADFYSITDLSWDARLLTNWCKWFDWEELKVKHIGNDMFLVEAKFDEYIAVYYVNGQTNRAMQAKDWVQDKDDDFRVLTDFNDGYAIGILTDSYSELWMGYIRTNTSYKLAYVDVYGNITVLENDVDYSDVFKNRPGIYSDGLFYLDNAFYDINFNMVLDLSEKGWGNANTEYSIPHFENGICRLITYKNGKYWTFEIDKSGNMLTEVEEYDISSSN